MIGVMKELLEEVETMLGLAEAVQAIPGDLVDQGMEERLYLLLELSEVCC